MGAAQLEERAAAAESEAEEIEAKLFVGAHDPSMFDSTVYPTQPSTTTGTAAEDKVSVYLHATSNAPIDAIFEIQQNGTLTNKKAYYASKWMCDQGT